MTQQIRLFLDLPKLKGEEIYARAEAAFEEEGWPLASFDDEENGIFAISLYVTEKEEKAARARLSALAATDIAAVKREVLPQIDWVKHSLAGLKPVRAGHFFVHGAHDRARLPPGAIGIEIEANRAFGTGHHGTTAGCLEMLEKIITAEKPTHILDIGTGSGILAIAAAKLGKNHVLATDNDPLAIAIAAENVALNGVRKTITLACAEGFAGASIAQAAPFDLIMANILAGPIIAMAEAMVKALKPGGSLLLSGLLTEQSDAVAAAYQAYGAAVVDKLFKQGWATLHLRRPAAG
ncbi:50S ribosomal protein L11 methyltransferase [Candidatus Tokpelaia sp.]|uniref:50S ribosomal protein L11 methyltransferase n=1 Tax=Candidatus Tokpelaia sp. TaxID=2233777 RepID=UPI00123A4CC9|nr:50S ribosomal protein L11 methyltransferase [Candidatus Tokpelaia sp.]KAA6405884.1 50S ribosomal protein L11 methyltransferase [Candidatus Tokpelaia sp.]